MPTETSLPLWKRLLFAAVALIGIPVILVALIEGVSSLLLLQRDLSNSIVPVVRERRHTVYDTLLGWAAEPNFYDQNLYGPGIYLRTNAQGFRNEHPIAPDVSPGRIRAVCSGNSFTLGWGVDNDHNWCRLLEQRIPGLESVNMGQGGYGVDQAYLWYKRDGQPLNHDLQIFAVILGDFKRMRYSDFRGFGKPVLRADGDSMQVENVPVPRWSYHWPRLAAYLYSKRPAFGHLRMSMLVQLVQRRSGWVDPRADTVGDQERRVVERLFQDLVALNRAKGSRLVVVFLPMRRDWTDSNADGWRRVLAAAAPRDGYTFVDLVEEFRRVPRDSLDGLFLRPRGPYPHYGNGGHEWAANRIVQHLRTIPGLVPVFDSAGVAIHPAAR